MGGPAGWLLHCDAPCSCLKLYALSWAQLFSWLQVVEDFQKAEVEALLAEERLRQEEELSAIERQLADSVRAPAQQAGQGWGEAVRYGRWTGQGGSTTSTVAPTGPESNEALACTPPRRWRAA